MTLKELRDLFRSDMRDNATPTLFSDAECNEFANDAVMEAVRRGFTITDTVTPETCLLEYTTYPVLDLDCRVIAIRTAIVQGQIVPLERMSIRRMERLWPGWRTTTTKYPTTYIYDYASNQIRLYPTPTQGGVIELSVAREPLCPLRHDTDVPELPARYHRSLIFWMRYRGYDKDDTETRDQTKVDRFEQRFVAEFGQRKSARNEKWQEEQAGLLSDTLA